jgi:hypothetical protein
MSGSEQNTIGSWTERVLHTFKNRPAANPAAGLILNGAGNLYGTTCGYYDCGFGSNDGTVFKLAPNSDGSWTYIVLHQFVGTPAEKPVAGLAIDTTTGNLYGMTESCGSANCRGVIFEITP